MLLRGLEPEKREGFGIATHILSRSAFKAPVLSFERFISPVR